MAAAGGSGRRSARERLLEAADRLFYTEGVSKVGIDRVLEESGVAKGSLYYNFGGKDDLVRTYLENRHAKWARRLDERVAAEVTPPAKVLTIFDALGTLFAEPDFRGCAFHNAAAESTPGSGADLAIKDFRTWLHELFAVQITDGGYADPQQLTRQLVQLYDGANIAAALDGDPQAAETARQAAQSLLENAPRT